MISDINSHRVESIPLNFDQFDARKCALITDPSQIGSRSVSNGRPGPACPVPAENLDPESPHSRDVPWRRKTPMRLFPRVFTTILAGALIAVSATAPTGAA